MSWKLHEVKEQAILCTREQEVFKADEFIGQVAVRFVTLQVSARASLCGSCAFDVGR